MENIENIIPNTSCLILLVGPSGAGKSTLCEKYFEPHEIVSSDAIRDFFTGDFKRQDKNKEVFVEFARRIRLLLSNSKRVVADATHLRDKDRYNTVKLAEEFGVPVFYVIVNRPIAEKIKTGGWRNHTTVRGQTLIEYHEDIFNSNENQILSGDNNKNITVIDTRGGKGINVIKSLPRDRISAAHSIYDRGFTRIRVVGDVHGNIGGLKSVISQSNDKTFFIFLGDITDYGDYSWDVATTVNKLVSTGHGIMVRGNHDKKMYNYISQTLFKKNPYKGTISFGMDISVSQLKTMKTKKSISYQTQYMSLVERSPDWVELDDWIFVHAAATPEMYGNTSFRAHTNTKIETMAMYGETDGTIVNGYPHRTYEWVNNIPEGKNVVVGHQIMSVHEPVVRETGNGGRVVFLDTGSSKSVNSEDGFLSFWDMDIVDQNGIIKLNPNNGFRSE